MAADAVDYFNAIVGVSARHWHCRTNLNVAVGFSYFPGGVDVGKLASIIIRLFYLDFLCQAGFPSSPKEQKDCWTKQRQAFQESRQEVATIEEEWEGILLQEGLHEEEERNEEDNFQDLADKIIVEL